MLQPERVFGRANTLTGTKVVEGYDFSKIDRLVPHSDWRRETILQGVRYTALRDMEDDGLVRPADTKGRAGQIYGPVYIPPHDFRILYGESAR